MGLAALQMARNIGAVTIGTSSASKHEFLKNQGLNHPIDYRVGDWMKNIMDRTDGRGVELILDPIRDEWMIEILKGVNEDWLRPRIDRTFRFEESSLVHQHIEERRNIGKVVLTLH